jgi:hypothetical protein
MVVGKTCPHSRRRGIHFRSRFLKQGWIGCIDEGIQRNLTVFLEIIQQEDPGLISETDDVQAN